MRGGQNLPPFPVRVLKDCSRSSIIFNQCRVLLRRINFEKIKRNGNKNVNQLLANFFFKVEIFFVKSHIATPLAFYATPNWRITPTLVNFAYIFIAM